VHDPLGIRERVDRDDPVVHHGEADDRNGLAVKRDHGARRPVHQGRMDDPRRVGEQERSRRNALDTPDNGRSRQRPEVGTYDGMESQPFGFYGPTVVTVASFMLGGAL
jgi:hypothetical protein